MKGVIRWGEIPVPYVAAWTSEKEIIFKPEPLVEHKLAVFRDGRRGDGKPLFGQMSEERTRAAVIKSFCQVCTTPLKGEGYASDRVMGNDGMGAPIINEPLTCRRCAKYSLEHCPGIARLRDPGPLGAQARVPVTNPRFILARVRYYRMVVGYLQPVEGGTQELNDAFKRYNHPGPIVGPVRPALVDYDIITPDEL